MDLKELGFYLFMEEQEKKKKEQQGQIKEDYREDKDRTTGKQKT